MTYHPLQTIPPQSWRSELCRGIIRAQIPASVEDSCSSTVKKSKSSYRIARIGGWFIYHGFLTVPAFQLLCAVEQRFLARTRARCWGGDKKEEDGRGKRKGEEEDREENKKRKENGGSYFALWTWTRVVWSFTLSWCIRTLLEMGAKREGRRGRGE